MVIFKGKTVQKSSRFPKFSGPDIKNPPLVHDQNGPKGGGFLKGMGLILNFENIYFRFLKVGSQIPTKLDLLFIEVKIGSDLVC